MTKLRQLSTVDEVLAALGGDHAVAKLTSRGRRGVSNWRMRGGFPPTLYVIMSDALAARDWEASPELWGMEIPVRGKVEENAEAA